MQYAGLAGEGEDEGDRRGGAPVRSAALMLLSAAAGAWLMLCILSLVGAAEGGAPAGATAAAAAGAPRSGGDSLLLSLGFADVQFGRHGLFYSLLGRLLMMLGFLTAAVKLGASGFIGLAAGYGFPTPAITGWCAEVVVAVGAILILLAPLISSAWCSILGADLLIIFMIVSTYVAHFKPLSTTEGEAKENHLRHLMKDVAIIGALILLAAEEV